MIAQQAQQVQQLNSVNLSGAQLLGLSPQSESVIIADSVYTVASIPSATMRTLTVQTFNSAGTGINGYTINIYDHLGNLAKTGPSPLAVSLPTGSDVLGRAERLCAVLLRRLARYPVIPEVQAGHHRGL